MSKWFCYDAGGPKINMLWKAGAKVVFAWNLSLITSSKISIVLLSSFVHHTKYKCTVQPDSLQCGWPGLYYISTNVQPDSLQCGWPSSYLSTNVQPDSLQCGWPTSYLCTNVQPDS